MPDTIPRSRSQTVAAAGRAAQACLMELANKAGRVAGLVLAPLTAAGARARKSRLFHPTGLVFRATVQPIAGADVDSGLSQALAGPALVRLSAAWWKAREWPDVLGVAIRFRRSETLAPERLEGDFDLLLATVRSPWTTLLAPLSTYQHDFFANDYYGVSPFRAEGREVVVALRLVPEHRPHWTEGDRYQRLDRAVAQRAATFRLEERAGRRGLWRPTANLTLLERVPVDDARLRFAPWIAGRGLQTVGFVQAMRPAAYQLAQAARGLISAASAASRPAR
ncbi:MAG: hypothetical protein QM765_26365 [Myxococcales bacterium]